MFLGLVTAAAAILCWYLGFRLYDHERKAIRQRTISTLKKIEHYDYLDFWHYVTDISRQWLIFLNYTKTHEISILKTGIISLGSVFVVIAFFYSETPDAGTLTTKDISLSQAFHESLMRPLIFFTLGIHAGYTFSLIITVTFLAKMKESRTPDFILYLTADIIVAYFIATFVFCAIIYSHYFNTGNGPASLQSYMWLFLAPYLILSNFADSKIPAVFLVVFASPLIPTFFSIIMALFMAALKWPFNSLRKELVRIISAFARSKTNEYYLIAASLSCLSGLSFSIADWLST